MTYVDFAPSEQFTNARFYYSSPDIRGVCIVKDLCLEGSHISSGKSEKKKKKNDRQRLDRGALNTCAKFQSLSKTAWTFGRLCG